MKIQSLMKDTSYFGYEAHGFYLKPNEISKEMPPVMAANTYLKSDVEAGRVRLLCDATDRSNLKALNIALPTFDKAAVVPPPVVQKAALPRITVDIMKQEIDNMVGSMKTTADKIKYLEETLLKGKPQIRGLVAETLAKLKTMQSTDLTSHPKRPKPSEEVAEEKPAEIKATEPMINLGKKKVEPVDEPDAEPAMPVRTKALAQMSKLELLTYGIKLGCRDIDPMTAHKDLKSRIADKEQELGVNTGRK